MYLLQLGKQWLWGSCGPLASFLPTSPAAFNPHATYTSPPPAPPASAFPSSLCLFYPFPSTLQCLPLSLPLPLTVRYFGGCHIAVLVLLIGQEEEGVFMCSVPRTDHS